MSFIHNNLAALSVALVVCGFGWMFGGRDPEVVLKIMPWLTVFMVESALFFPQRRDGESTSHARTRVWRDLKKSPLVWTAIGFLVLLCIPFMNTGLCPDCDYGLIAQGHSVEPPIAFLPFCVDIAFHREVFMWFMPSLLAMLAARYCLTRAGKRTLLEMIVWNGVAMAAVGFVQQLADAPGPLWRPFPNNVHVYFFSTFGYPNMAGCYFAVLFCLSVSLWRWNYDDVHENIENTHEGRRMSSYRMFWMKHYMMMPSLVCLFAAFVTLSRAAIIFVSSAAAILFLHSAAVQLAKMKKADRVRAMALCLLSLVLLAVAASAFMPDSVTKEMSTVDTRGALDRVTGRGEYHSKVATELWHEHMFFGIGGWGYIHFSPLKLPPRRYWGPGSANVHNDHLQFLLEHGLIGYLCLVVMVVLLLSPLCNAWMRLSKSVRFLPKRSQPPPPQALFALPGSAFAVLVAAAIPVLHAFGDCPLRSSAVLSLFFTSLACVTGYLPHEAVQPEHDRHSHH